MSVVPILVSFRLNIRLLRGTFNRNPLCVYNIRLPCNVEVIGTVHVLISAFSVTAVVRMSGINWIKNTSMLETV